VACECNITADEHPYVQWQGLFVALIWRGIRASKCTDGVFPSQYGLLAAGGPLEDEAVFEEEQTFDSIFGWMTVFAGDAG
jgi:hypothetical protein